MSTVTSTEMETYDEADHQSLASLAGGAQDLGQLRLQKIREYLAEALKKPDPLEANLGAAAGDLMWMSAEAVGSPPKSPR